MDHVLSARQVEVLSLMGQGLTNRQIGDRLGVSEATIKSHVTSTLQRLGVDNRVRAAMIAAADDPSALDRRMGARANLTSRQGEIVDLVGQGLTNREIGRRLFLSEKTVKNQLRLIFVRLGASNRAHAAVIASERQAVPG